MGELREGNKVRMLDTQNESIFHCNSLALTFASGLCIVPVHLINFNSLPEISGLPLTLNDMIIVSEN